MCGGGERMWWQSSKEGRKEEEEEKERKILYIFCIEFNHSETLVIFVWGKMFILERVLPGTYTSVGKID